MKSKEKVILVANKSNPSEFIEELRYYPEVHIAEGQLIGNGDYFCEECKTGRLELTYPNRIRGWD